MRENEKKLKIKIKNKNISQMMRLTTDSGQRFNSFVIVEKVGYDMCSGK
jgi:hypothetical protein